MEEDIIVRTRIEKQAFLRSEIIEKGYNPNFFQRFVESLKEDGFLIRFFVFKSNLGANIDNWTFEELTEVFFIQKKLI